jgi:hypothetical protein
MNELTKIIICKTNSGSGPSVLGNKKLQRKDIIGGCQRVNDPDIA